MKRIVVFRDTIYTILHDIVLEKNSHNNNTSLNCGKSWDYFQTSVMIVCVLALWYYHIGFKVKILWGSVLHQAQSSMTIYKDKECVLDDTQALYEIYSLCL